MPDLDVFRLKLWKNYCHVSSFEFAKIQCFLQNKDTLNLGPKMSYLCVFKMEFEKTIVIFDASTFQFFKI